MGSRRAGLAAGQTPGRTSQKRSRATQLPAGGAVQLDKRGCIFVDHHLNPPGLPNIFITGDLAHFEQDGHQVPGVAQPAMQMGTHAARIIAADLKGKPRPKFRYFDKGDMATIGRMSAVARVQWPFKAHMSGFPAWITWITVHIFFLIGFRNRLAVLTSWVWTYFTFSRGARLITGDQSLPAGRPRPIQMRRALTSQSSPLHDGSAI